MKWNDLNKGYASRVEALKAKRPHEILQVDENASLAEVKAAHRRLAKVYHPDCSDPFLKSSNAEVLKIINCAYEAMTKRTPTRK